MTLQGYEASRALDLDLAKDLHTAAQNLATELGDRAAQAENLLALGHLYLLRTTTRTLHGCLPRHGRWSSSSMTRTIWGTSTKGSLCWPFPRAMPKQGEALLDDVSRRFRELDKAAMGATYALGLADVYRRAGRQALAAALLRHALSLMDEARNPEQYAKVRRGPDRRRGRSPRRGRTTAMKTSLNPRSPFGGTSSTNFFLPSQE